MWIRGQKQVLELGEGGGWDWECGGGEWASRQSRVPNHLDELGDLSRIDIENPIRQGYRLERACARSNA